MDEDQKKQNLEQEVNSNEKNQNTSNFNINSEELKKETSQTVQDVKDTIKNANFKKDTKAAKGFFMDFLKSPLESIKRVANDSKNSFLKIAIIILVIWLVAILLKNIFSIVSIYLFGYLGSFEYFFRHLFSNILNIVKDLIAPIISIATISSLVYGFKANKNKSFLSIISTLLVARIPVVVAQIFSLLTLFGSGVSKLTSAFSGFCNILSTVLLYFAIKEFSDETNKDSYFWKFALIMGILYVIKFVFSYLGIYL